MPLADAALRKRFWKDTFTLYRPSFSDDAKPTWTTIATNQPCDCYNTPNYDDSKTAAGLAKVENFLTANPFYFDQAIQAQSGDVIAITLRIGVGPFYFKIRGEVQLYTDLPCAFVMLTKTTEHP